MIMKTKIQKSKGFTLIETLVVLALIATTAAIAIPNYREYVLRAGRTEARNMLLDIAARQERFRYNSPVYAATLALLGLPTPYLSENRKYSLTMTVVAAAGVPSTYVLTAVPQANQIPDKCGFLRLNNVGVQTSQNSVPNCWGQ